MKHKKKQKHLEGRYFIKTARMSKGPCNTQEHTPQRQSPVEAAACSQAAGERSDFSKCFICVFSPSKRPSLDKDEPCNTKDDAPLPKSPEETPACSQAAKGKSDFPKPFICVFSPSKHPRLDEDGKRKSREDAVQRRHKAVALTQRQKARKASSSDSISSKDKGNGAGRCISQDNVPQPEAPVEAPACSQAAGEKPAFSEHLIGVSTPSKRPRPEEDGKRKSREDALQRRHKAVALTQRQKARKASSSDSISSKDKGNGAGRCISQDNVPQPEAPVEAPACSQAAGEKPAFSEHLIGVSTPSKRPRPEEDGKRKSREDALQRRHKAVALTQRQKARKASSSDSISSKDKGNGAGRCISQVNVPQPEAPVEAPACSQAAGEKPAFSEHLIGVSTPSKRPRPEEDGKRKSREDALQRRHKAVALTQRQKARKASSSDSISSKDKGNGAGCCISQDNVPQPEAPVEAPACSQAAGEKPAFSEHLIGVSTPSKRPRPEEDGKLISREDALQRRHKSVALTQHQKARKASSSDSISSKDKGNGAGRCISQDNVPQPEAPVEAPACSQAAGEKPAFSEHLIGVSTPSKRPRPEEDEIKEMPVNQDLEQTEDSSDHSHTYIPSHALNNNEPFLSAVHETDVRLMKIYYMRVQLKRGVAVLYHTKEGLVPPSKKIKMEEMTYIGKVHKNVPFSHMSVKKPLISHEPMLDSRTQDKSGEADSPAQPPAPGGYPRVKTPEWLVALDSGFRCMACCRVFPSLEVLQEHVECGVREGFSCHVFHNAMAHLKYKERKNKKKERKKKATLRCQKEKHFGMKTNLYN